MMILPFARQPAHQAGLSAALFYVRHGVLLLVLMSVGFLVAVWQHWIHFSLIGVHKYLWGFSGLLMLLWPFIALPTMWQHFRRAKAEARDVLRAIAILALVGGIAWGLNTQLQRWVA